MQRWKKLLFSFSFSIILLACFTNIALADNKDVLDQANIIAPKVQENIKNINDNQMSEIKGHPQIAVVTKKTLKGTGTDNIDEYGQQLFDKYHFGNKKYDNGVVLIVTLHPHKVRMQTGYGLESILPDSYINTLMDDQVKGLFKEKKYSAGINIMVNKIANRIESQSSKIKTNKQRETENAIKFRDLLAIILIPSILIAFFKFNYDKKYKSDSKKFDNLIEQRNLSSFDRAYLSNLSLRKKAEAINEIGKGIAAGIVIDRLLSERDYHSDDNDDDDHFDNSGFNGFTDFGGFSDNDFGGFGGDSGGGGGDSSW